MGLKNFAIADPIVSTGVKIWPTINLAQDVGFEPLALPTRLTWGVTVYWKRNRNMPWPQNMLVKSVPYQTPTVSNDDFFAIQTYRRAG